MRWQRDMWTFGMAALVLALGNGPAGAATEPGTETKAKTETRSETGAREAWLGVYTQTLTPELREGLNYTGSGALVSRVVDGSPAEKAGVEKGDVIVGISTRTVASASDLTSAIRASKAGQTVAVRIVRDGQRRTLNAVLAESPAEEFEWSEGHAPGPPGTMRFKSDGDFEFLFDDVGPGFAMMRGGRGRLGVRVENLNPDLASYFGVKDAKGALVVEVLKDTPAEKAGLKAGDVITRVGDKAVNDSDDLVRALREADQKVTLTVVRKSATRTIESELREGPRALRVFRDAPFAYDGDDALRARRESMEDVRRELEELRRELRDLKSKMEEKSRN